MPLMGVPVPALALAGLTPELSRAAQRSGLTQALGLLELNPTLAYASVAMRKMQHTSRNSY